MPRAKKTRRPPITTLHDALRAGDVEAARARLDAGDDPRGLGPSGMPLLLEALTYLPETDDALALAALLLARGADPDAAAGHYDRPIFVWAYAGNARAVRLLLDHGASIEGVSTSDQHTLLHCAAAGGIPWLAARCLAAGSDPNALSSQGHSPLQYAMDALRWRAVDAPPKDCLGVAELLVAAGARLDHLGASDWGTPLHWAAARGTAASVRWLLARGVAVDARTVASRETPLHQAAQWGEAESVRALLDAGADLHATDAAGWTALHFAALAKSPDSALLLRARGARNDVKSTEARRVTSTRYAARKTPLEVAGRNKDQAVRDALA